MEKMNEELQEKNNNLINENNINDNNSINEDNTLLLGMGKLNENKIENIVDPSHTNNINEYTNKH